MSEQTAVSLPTFLQRKITHRRRPANFAQAAAALDRLERQDDISEVQLQQAKADTRRYLSRT